MWQYGLYHLTNADSSSWFEFARHIFQLAGMTADLSAITSQEYGAVARRPAYSVLAAQKWSRLGVDSLRPWRLALEAYLEERHHHDSVAR